ncbi:MAG: hypothetical protein M4579_007359, partial [Chaenotheca gracillima]
MGSPPSTPAPTGAPKRSEWRFVPLYDAVEWVEDYRLGKLHPVNFGDVFKDGRFRVIRKLGYGSFSTVWLARDQQYEGSRLRLERFVAMKILSADASTSADTEIKFINYLTDEVPDSPGKKNVMSILDVFNHSGPNGDHTCIVFEAMGPNADSMVDELPGNKPKYRFRTNRYPPWMAKSMLRQALLGLDFLHKNGVCHGDFQPGNLLFSLKDLTAVGDNLSQDFSEDAVSDPIQRVDGSNDPSAPKFLAIDQPLTKYTDLSPEFVLKVSDLGAAFFVSDPPKKDVTPVSLCSPELVLEGKTGLGQDVWSFGCLVYEFLTSQHLFVIWPGKDNDLNNDEMILKFIGRLGPLPETLLSKWPRSKKYFDEKGKQRKYPVKDPNGNAGSPEELESQPYEQHEIDSGRGKVAPLAESENSPQEVASPPASDEEEELEWPCPSIEKAFDKIKNPELGLQEADEIKNLLRYILQYDPEKRPST